MKSCIKCNESKSLCSFSRDKNRKDGLYVYCKACTKVMHKEHYIRNYDSINARVANYAMKNPDKVAAAKAEWQKDNPEKVKESTKRYSKLNPHKVLARTNKRRASKLNATPSWLTEEHHKQMADMYWLAKDLEAISGEKYHVDHIIPLQGKTVCGLHVPWNLQVLPADINVSKGTTYTG